jgi:ornithine decarboxylase
MRLVPALWSSPRAHLLSTCPDEAVLYFAPDVLQATARRFMKGFPGLVTYAVKANDAVEVLENLVAAGMTAFDVASPSEMQAVRAVAPGAVLHYNNPVRSACEIRMARAMGVASYSVDCFSELDKLMAADLPDGTEIAVRLHLPVPGAAYDFGSKFGASPDLAAALLRRVAASGLTPAMTFHPGTQCASPAAWAAYIAACADVARTAGVTLARLNVGGGFAAHRSGSAPDLDSIFRGIADAVKVAFGAPRPALLCEPGRAMVADACTVGARIKAIRPDGSVFLNDGIYGSFAEAPILGGVDRVEVVRLSGQQSGGPFEGRVIFGPTCDSLDRLPGRLSLPRDIAEGDWILFHGMGAYSRATLTRFNGYGCERIVTVERLG